MKVKGDRLQELIDMQEYYLTHCDFDMSTRDKKDLLAEFMDMRSSLEELQSLRKIDIAGTLKYAEEAGAAIEELKHGVEEAIKEIEGEAKIPLGLGSDNGMMCAKDIIKKHVSKYLDE